VSDLLARYTDEILVRISSVVTIVKKKLMMRTEREPRSSRRDKSIFRII
jgi:hypothetical protein